MATNLLRFLASNARDQAGRFAGGKQLPSVRERTQDRSQQSSSGERAGEDGDSDPLDEEAERQGISTEELRAKLGTDSSKKGTRNMRITKKMVANAVEVLDAFRRGQVTRNANPEGHNQYSGGKAAWRATDKAKRTGSAGDHVGALIAHEREAEKATNVGDRGAASTHLAQARQHKTHAYLALRQTSNDLHTENTNNAKRRECPECGGEVDEDGECEECGYVENANPEGHNQYTQGGSGRLSEVAESASARANASGSKEHHIAAAQAHSEAAKAHKEDAEASYYSGSKSRRSSDRSWDKGVAHEQKAAEHRRAAGSSGTEVTGNKGSSDMGLFGTRNDSNATSSNPDLGSSGGRADFFGALKGKGEYDEGKGGKSGPNYSGGGGSRASVDAHAASRKANKSGKSSDHAAAASEHREAAEHHRNEGDKDMAKHHADLARSHTQKAKSVANVAWLRGLIANCTCPETAAELRQVLNEASGSGDGSFDAALMAGREGDGDEDDDDQGKAEKAKRAAKAKAAFTGNRLTPAEREALSEAQQIVGNQKLAIARQLVANIQDDERREARGLELMGKSLGELRGLLELVGNWSEPQHHQERYEQAPPLFGPTGLAINEGGHRGGDDDTLDCPTINWDAKQTA